MGTECLFLLVGRFQLVHPIIFFHLNVNRANNLKNSKLYVFIKIQGIRTSVFKVQMEFKGVQVF